MAKLSGSLKDEEVFGGFDSDPNDDTFMLAREMDYPGDIPDFDTPAVPEPIKKAAEEEQLEVNYEGVTKAPMISMGDQPGAESVWDMFDSPAQTGANPAQPEQIDAPSSAIDDDISLNDITDENIDAGAPIAIPERETIEKEEIPVSENDIIVDEENDWAKDARTSDDSATDSEYEGDTIDREFLNEPESNEIEPDQEELFRSEQDLPVVEIETPDQDEKFEIAVKELDEPSEESLNKSIDNIEEFEDISLDDNFKRQLLEDLENSRKKKKKGEQEEVIVKKVSLSEEEPVTEKITFGDYKADHPSTFGIEGDEEEDNLEEDNDKKKRFALPWKYLAYAAVVVLLLTGISIGGYYIITQTDLFTAKLAEETEQKKEQTAKAVTPRKIAAKPVIVLAKAEQKPEPKPDTAP